MVVAGSGSAYSPGRCTSSIIIDTPEETLVIDYGTCTSKTLARMGIGLDEPLHIFTHRHADHVLSAGLSLFYLGFKDSTKPFRVIGGPDIPRILDNLRLLAASTGSPNPPPVEYVAQLGPGAIHPLAPRLRLLSIEALHTVPAYSLLVDYDGVKILVSGDTAPTAVYREKAAESSLAIHEATLTTRHAEYEAETGHSTVSSAIKQVEPAGLGLLYHLTKASAEEAEEKTVMLAHIYPARDGAAYKVC